MRIGPVLRAYRRRKLAKMFPNGKISAHFRYQEFACHDGTPIPIRAVPGIQAHTRRYLEPLRAKFGPCHVLSGYRHERYNISIGGAKDSQHDWDKHPQGTATDLTFARGTPSDWAREAMRIRNATGGTGGVGLYTHQGFLHLDSRPKRADWVG
jgi:hypothetical protein